MTAYNVAPIRFAGVSQVTATLGVNDPQTGDRCSESGIEYVFVQNTGNSQASVQLGMTVSAAVGYSATVSTVTDSDVLVGVVRHATLPTGAYGWLATKGFVTVNFGANNSAAAGGFLGIGTDGAFANRIASAQTGVPCPPVFGKVMSAVASGASVGVYLTCP